MPDFLSFLADLNWEVLTQVGMGGTALYYARQCLALQKKHEGRLNEHDGRIVKLETHSAPTQVQGYLAHSRRRATD